MNSEPRVHPFNLGVGFLLDSVLQQTCWKDFGTWGNIIKRISASFSKPPSMIRLHQNKPTENRLSNIVLDLSHLP